MQEIKNLLQTIKESLLHQYTNKEDIIRVNDLIKLIDSERHFSNITEFKILTDDNGKNYFQYSYSDEEYEIDSDYWISIIKGTLVNDYKDLAVLVDSICLLSSDNPVQYVQIYRIDGVIERYNFNYNKEQTEDKKLTLNKINSLRKI